MNQSPSTQLIVALDVSSEGEAQELFERLRSHVAWFKIGSQLFTAAGAGIVRKIVAGGGRVFLDLKFHDIPNTVAAATREAARLGVSILNVHASGGTEMMRRAAEMVAETTAHVGLTRPQVIGVTVLTSHDERSLHEAGFDSRLTLADHALRLAGQARDANLDGVVASVYEAARIKAELGADFLVVAPGVRLAGSRRDDQSRVATPADAVRAGVDYIVVGRAILDHADPPTVIEAIKREIAEASHSMATADAGRTL